MKASMGLVALALVIASGCGQQKTPGQVEAERRAAEQQQQQQQQQAAATDEGKAAALREEQAKKEAEAKKAEADKQAEEAKKAAEAKKEEAKKALEHAKEKTAATGKKAAATGKKAVATAKGEKKAKGKPEEKEKVGTTTITESKVPTTPHPGETREAPAPGGMPETEKGRPEAEPYVNHSTTLGDGKSGMYTDGQGTYGGRATWGTGTPAR